MQVRLRVPHPLAPGIPRMVTASATLHVVVGAAAIILPSVLPRPAGPSWDIVLPGVIVNLPPAASPPPSTAAPAAAAAAEPTPSPESDPPPPPPRKKPPKKKSPPEASPDPPRVKPRKTATPAAAKKAVTTLPRDAAPTGAAGSPTESVGPGGTGGVTETDAGIGLSFGGASFGYSYYTAQLINKLRANWQRPIHPGSGQTTLSVRVLFTIGRHGQVSGARVEVTSSSPTLDSSALRAVFAAAPFPPLPPQVTEDSLHVAITFTLEPSGL